MKLKKNRGITLIALIITIIVMLILAGVSLNAIVGDNGILSNATKAASASTYANYLEELQIALVSSGDTPTVVGESLKNYISSISDSDLENFMILKGELYYIGSSDSEAEAAEMVGISTDLSGGSAAEVITIINSVIILEDNYIGTKLLDKNQTNGTSWNLAIDYNSSNTEIARYETGYYLLEPDIEYTINGETVTFSNYYVVDYANHNLISSNNLVNWNFNSTVAVTEGLVLNLDPTNLENIDYVETTVTDDSVAGEGVETTAYQLYEDGTDTGITVYGDVVYDEDTLALVFNESDDNVLLASTGEAGGGYLKLTEDSEGNEIDFSDGFSFEIYANLSRFEYDNGSIMETNNPGLFIMTANLFASPGNMLRFTIGWNYETEEKIMSVKPYSRSSWYGEGYNFVTSSNGGVDSKGRPSENEDFYMTFIWRVFDTTSADDYQLEYYEENGLKIDKVELYLNGNLYGYSYYGSDSYKSGLAYWNVDGSQFYVGLAPISYTSNFYYLKGSVYSTRLYTYSMTKDEVSENYKATVQYRNSFAN